MIPTHSLDSLKFAWYDDASAAAKTDRLLSGRKVAELPTSEEYQAKWKELGIEWLRPIDGNDSAKALLPKGWQIKKGMVCDSIDLLDENRIPRVSIIEDCEFTVYFLSQEGSESLIKQEKEVADILKNRFTKPSKEHPYGVFYIKTKRIDNSFHSYTYQIKSYHGFFSSKEIANKAKEILGRGSMGLFSSSDVYVAEEIDEISLKKEGFQLANGFKNPVWWKNYRGSPIEMTGLGGRFIL